MFMWCERACVFTNELARARAFFYECACALFFLSRVFHPLRTVDSVAVAAAVVDDGYAMCVVHY